MKLFSSIATSFVTIAAVISSSYLIPVPAQASNCLGLQGAEKTACKAKNNVSTSRVRASAISRSCQPGTRYYKIRVGGLIKRTAAEGCFTGFQAAQLRMQANANQQQRLRNFQQNLNESFRSPRNCSGTINSWGNSGYATYNTTCY